MEKLGEIIIGKQIITERDKINRKKKLLPNSNIRGIEIFIKPEETIEFRMRMETMEMVTFN